MARPTTKKGERVWVAVSKHPIVPSTQWLKKDVKAWLLERFRFIPADITIRRATLTLDETATKTKRGKR